MTQSTSVAAKGYKIKMDDGSEVGPMTLEAVEGWYRQGLVKHDNMVQRPDSYKWVPLSEILARDLKKKEEKERVEQVRQAVAAAPKPAPAQPRPRPKPAPAAAPEPKAEPVTIDVPAGLWKGVIALLLLGGLAGAGYYGYKTVLQESEHSQRVREFQSEVKSEPATGFQVPAGWVALRSEQQFFSVPSSARLLLAHARSGAFAFVASEISPQGIGGVDQYLDAMLARRKRAGLPSYKEESRRDAAPGGLPGREATAVWGSDDPRQQELVRVWKDGWNYNAIVAWAVQGKPDGAAAIAALSDGVPTGGVASAQLAKVIDEVTREVPHFTRAVAESLMAQSAAQVLEPAEAFRRGNALMSRGIPALSPAEGRELGALMQAVYSTMQARDRSKLSGYIDRLRARSLTTPQDDREMCFVMKGGVLKLPAARRARLQALFEKAIAAGLKVPG